MTESRGVPMTRLASDQLAHPNLTPMVYYVASTADTVPRRKPNEMLPVPIHHRATYTWHW